MVAASETIYSFSCLKISVGTTKLVVSVAYCIHRTIFKLHSYLISYNEATIICVKIVQAYCRTLCVPDNLQMVYDKLVPPDSLLSTEIVGVANTTLITDV